MGGDARDASPGPFAVGQSAGKCCLPNVRRCFVVRQLPQVPQCRVSKCEYCNQDLPELAGAELESKKNDKDATVQDEGESSEVPEEQ